MTFDLYQEAILEELRHPQNKRPMENPDVIVAETNASCGDTMTVFIQFSAEGTIIREITWQGSGCAISQASMSLLSQKVQGMERAAVLQLQQADIEELLGLEQPIAYGRIKCLLLGLTAIQKAVRGS